MPRSCQALHAVVARSKFSHNSFFFSFSFSTKLSAQLDSFFSPVFTFLCKKVSEQFTFFAKFQPYFIFFFFLDQIISPISISSPCFKNFLPNYLTSLIFLPNFSHNSFTLFFFFFSFLNFCPKLSDPLASSFSLSLFLLFLYFCAKLSDQFICFI